jgi:hypothetical protein
MDYQNGKIYRIVCEETHRVYIGSTCSTLVKRLSNHKSRIKSGKNDCTCKDFINPKIFLIEDYPCDRKDQLLMRERYHMENTDCVNLQRPIQTREERKEYEKKYQEKYRDRNYARTAQWRIDNHEYNKSYKRENVTCECGCIVSRSVLSRHKKSAKHNKLMLKNN